MVEHEMELKQKLPRWKRRMEAKGLKDNVGETTVMTGGLGTIVEFGSHACCVCLAIHRLS